MSIPAVPAPPPAPETPDPREQPALPSPGTRLTRWITVLSCAALLLLCVLWETVLAPTGRGTLALKALPLLLALPGLWRYRLYTYRWLSLAIWLYAAEGSVRATSEGGVGAWLAGIETVLSLVVFAGCTLHVRHRFAAARAQAPQQTSAEP